jgi:hypothetical protein
MCVVALDAGIGMTSRSYNNWLLIAGVLGISVSLFNPTAIAQNRSGFTAFVERDGRIVFTNLTRAVTTTPTAPPQGPTIDPTPAGPFDDLIQTISAQHGLDPALTRTVIEVESNFDRRAVSHAGAQGLMQLIPDTASRFGVRDPFDPEQNINGGVRYLRFLLDMFDGNSDLSVAAYNSKESRVARVGHIPNIAETQDYVRKVRASYIRMGGTPDRVMQVASIPDVASATPAAQAAPVVATAPLVNPRAVSMLSDSLAGGTAIVHRQGISRTVNNRGVVTITNFGTTR